MKRLLRLLALGAGILTPSAAFAAPYIQSPLWGGGKVYTSAGITTGVSDLKYDQAFTDVAVFYHPLSAGSIIPEALQTWLPPESWACTVGVGTSHKNLGTGCGVNLLDSVRSWGSNLLFWTGNETAIAMGDQIRPSGGPLNLYVGRQEDLSAHGKLVPRWFFGCYFGF